MVTASKGGRRVPIGVLSAFAGLAALIAVLLHGSRAPLSIARAPPRPAARAWQRHLSCVDGGNQTSSRLAGHPNNSPASRFSCDYEPDGQQDAMTRAFIPAWSRLQQSRKPRRIAPGLPHCLAQRARGGRLALIPRGRARDSYRVRVLISYAYDLNSRSSHSIDLRIEEFLRPRRIHVGLGDDVCAGIDCGRHILALRGS